MTDRYTAVLYSATQAPQPFRAAYDWTREKLAYAAVDGVNVRLVLEVRPETRSDAQNRLLHSRIRDIARQCEWAGRKWDVDSWRRLLTAAWCRVRNENVQMVPALDGNGFDVLYQRTSKLSRRDCAELSEYILAWGDGQSVQWSPTSLGELEPA